MKRYIKSDKRVVPTYVGQLSEKQQANIRKQLEQYELTEEEIQDAMDSKISDITGNPECPIYIRNASQGLVPEYEIEDPDEYADKTDAYIHVLDAYPEYQDDDPLAADVPFNNGTANFWQLAPNKWKLVVWDENAYNPDTYIYEHDTYWGDEELSPDNCNDVELTSDKLYAELSKLPGVNLDELYGLREVFEDFPNVFK